MKLPILLLLFAFALPASIWALEGRVVDTHGKPVGHADVSLLGYSGATPTDLDGRFTWTPDPALPFEVLVILPGGRYMAPVLVESLPEDGILEIVVAPLVNESVTVAAGAAPNIESTPASGMAVVPSEDIAERHAVRITEVLQNVPGTGQLSDLHSSVPSLRGLARGRTLLLIDGARVTTERRAGPSATFLDPFFLEGVEVSRGPGTVSYGSDAFGGVIDARTRKPVYASPTRVRMRGAIGAGLPELSGGAELTHGFERGGLVLQARYRKFESYESPEGEVFNSQASDRGFLGRVAYDLGPGSFSVGWQTDHGRDIGRPDTRGESVVTSYPNEDSNRLTATYDLEPRAGFTRVAFTGFWGSSRLLTQREEVADATDPRRMTQSDVKAKDFHFRALGVRPLGRGRIEMGLDVNGRYGLEAVDGLTLFDEDNDVLLDSEQLAIEDARRLDAAVYTNGEVLLGSRFTAGGGVRFDRVTTRNEAGFLGDASTLNNALSGYGSLKVELISGLSATGQVSSGFRDPTLSDRYFRGITGRGVVIGNPELQPERSLQFDAALRFVRERFRTSFYAYRYRFDDLIQRIEGEPDVFYFQNSGEAVLHGLELEFQGELTRQLLLQIGWQWERGKTIEDQLPLDDIPGTRLTVVLRRELASRGYVRVGAAVLVENDRPGPTEIVTPSYSTFDVGAGWELSDALELRLAVRNLFDTVYPVSPDRRAVLAPGRSAVVTFVAEF